MLVPVYASAEVWKIISDLKKIEKNVKHAGYVILSFVLSLNIVYIDLTNFKHYHIWLFIIIFVVLCTLSKNP